MAEDPNKLIAVKLLKPYRNYNAGEVAGFDYATVKALVDSDAAVVLEVKETTHKDPKTGEPFKRHEVVGERALEPLAPKKASPPPAKTATGTDGGAGSTPSGSTTPTGNAGGTK